MLSRTTLVIGTAYVMVAAIFGIACVFDGQFHDGYQYFVICAWVILVLNLMNLIDTIRSRYEIREQQRDGQWQEALNDRDRTIQLQKNEITALKSTQRGIQDKLNKLSANGMTILVSGNAGGSANIVAKSSPKTTLKSKKSK